MEKLVESVSLTIRMTDGRREEIPLEVWQVGIVTQLLGLQVDLKDPKNWRMSSRESCEERFDLYREAVRELHRKNRNKE